MFQSLSDMEIDRKFLSFIIEKPIFSHRHTHIETLKWRLTGMKFCSVLPGPRQCYKFFKNYLYLAITCKKFYPHKVESFFCTAGMLLFQDEIFPYDCFSPPKRYEKVDPLVWRKYIEIHFNEAYQFIFTTHMTSICEKKINKGLYRISSFCEYF